ncbi:hypothetical protein LJC23_05810 [Desulfovibrio sp. OttesenSCG-928-I05]|nr:hypothetical protein [Desulfovibrio sp. OttesenSCG-928-I05]
MANQPFPVPKFLYLKRSSLATGQVPNCALLPRMAPDSNPLRLEPILPGIFSIAAPGHTSGNTVLKVTHGSDSLLLMSDLVHFPLYQFANPSLTVIFDETPETAIATRKRIFDMAAEENIPLAGPHLEFPGIVMIRKAGNGYSYDAFDQAIYNNIAP